MYRGEAGQKESGSMKKKASLEGQQISTVDDVNSLSETWNWNRLSHEYTSIHCTFDN